MLLSVCLSAAVSGLSAAMRAGACIFAHASVCLSAGVIADICSAAQLSMYLSAAMIADTYLCTCVGVSICSRKSRVVL